MAADSTPLDDLTNPSPPYLALKAGMNAWDMWADMSATERLPVILDTFTVEDWFGAEAIPTLAMFRERPAGRWGQIKARYKSIGGNPFDLEKEVDKLLIAAKESHVQTSPAAAENHPSIVSLSTVETEAVEWLWWPYLAIGKLAILDGEPGVGKSLLSITLAAILSQGWPLPDQQGGLTIPSGAPSATLLLSAEDGLADTIRPRLEAVGADCTRIFALTGWRSEEDTPGEERPFTLEHIPVLAHALQQYRPRLVIIDPIQAYLGGKVDINRANETRPLLSLLGRLAETYRCAIVLVRHPAKGGQGRAIHRGLGSIDFIGAARTALFVEQHPLDQYAALLCQTKNNLGPLGRTHIFTKGDGVFHWQGVSRVSAEMLAGNERGPDPHAFLEAVFWLEQRLEGGLAWASADVLAEGENTGHSKKLLYKAKKSLGVVSAQLKDGWTWRVAPLPPIYPPSITTLSGHTEDTGTTGLTGVSDSNINGEPRHTPSTPIDPVYPDTPVNPVVYTRVTPVNNARDVYDGRYDGIDPPRDRGTI